MPSLDDAHLSPTSPIPASTDPVAGRGRTVGFAIVLAGGTGRRMGGASKPDVIVAGRRMLDHVLDELAAQKVPAVVVGPPDLDVPLDSPTGVTLVREDPPLGGPAAGIAAGYAAGINARYAAGTTGRPPHLPTDIAAGYADGITGHPPHLPTGDSPAPDSDVSARSFTADSPSSRPLIAILACDAPFAPRVLPDLVRAVTGTSDAVAETEDAGVADSGPVDPDNHDSGTDTDTVDPESVGAVAVTPDGRLQRLLCVVDSAALGAAIARLESDGGVRDRSVRALLGDLDLVRVDVPAWAMDADTPDDVIALEWISPRP